MSLSDADFERRFKVGKRYEKYVADWLESCGLEVEYSVDDNIIEGRDVDHFTTTDTDIVVGGKVIEVKSRAKTCTFTSPEDFPFDDCILDTVGGWKKKERKPDYYVVVSQVTGAMVVVDGSTSDEWEQRQVYDRLCGHKNNVFCAAKSLLHPIEWLLSELGCSDTNTATVVKYS